MITKKVLVELTRKEIDSPVPIEIVLTVRGEDEPEEGVDYVISYPKEKK